MKLDAYLKRIGFFGEPRADQATLTALVRAHILAVPFENLDVQLRRKLTTDITAAFEKIVERGRGGWCYEMNGLMGWALEQIGFKVTRLAGGVMREASGDSALGNHLCLMVECDGAMLVDVGFGGSMTRPIAFREGDEEHVPYRVGLKKVENDFWRFSENAGAGPFTYDVADQAADENLLAEKCRLLQTDAASPFVQNLVAQQRRENDHLILRGRVLTTIAGSGKSMHVIQDADELLTVLSREFRLHEPSIADLWAQILERHEAVFGAPG